MQYWIGCSGWQYDEWKGLFYPDDLAKKHWFDYYASQFNTVEINATFYRFPKPETLRKWYQNAPKGFTYTLKVPRFITHLKDKNKTERMLNDFYQLAELLQEKLNCILFQLPERLHYNETLLTNLLSVVNKKYTNVIEFRHPSWWQTDVYQRLQENQVIFCSVMAPELPTTLIASNKKIYLRVHGKRTWYQGSFTARDFNHWQTMITKCGANKVWIYFNNTAEGKAVNNALQLKKFLS